MAVKQKITKDNFNSPLRDKESWSYRPTKEKDKKDQKSGRRFFAFAGKGAGMTPDLVGQNNVAKQLRETNEILVQIQKQLTVDFTGRIAERKKEFNERRKALSEAKFFSKEKALESTKGVGKFVKDTAGKIVSPLGKGFKGIFEAVWGFLKNIVIGGAVIGALKWLSDPENLQKLKGVFDVMAKNWKWIVGGLAAIVGVTALGGIAGIIGAITTGLSILLPVALALAAGYGLYRLWLAGDAQEKKTTAAVAKYGEDAVRADLERKVNNPTLMERINGVHAEAKEQLHFLNTGLTMQYGMKGEEYLKNLEKKATGGSITGGRSYIVGENGPELLISGGSGYILDAQKTARLLTPPVQGNSFDIIPLPDKFIKSNKDSTVNVASKANKLVKVSSINPSNRYMVDVPEILGIR